MKPIENVYEEALLHQLAPVAQKGAEEVFSTWTLSQMLESKLKRTTPKAFLRYREIAPAYWPEMLDAALIAKLTYIRPDNPQLDREARTWLISVASILIGMPIRTYTLAEIVQGTRIKYPVLSQWLVKMAADAKA